jgi:hypothetical protein
MENAIFPVPSQPKPGKRHHAWLPRYAPRIALLRRYRNASPSWLTLIVPTLRRGNAYLGAPAPRNLPLERSSTGFPRRSERNHHNRRGLGKKAEADGLDEIQRAMLSARVRELVANSIECGEIPNTKISEEKSLLKPEATNEIIQDERRKRCHWSTGSRMPLRAICAWVGHYVGHTEAPKTLRIEMSDVSLWSSKLKKPSRFYLDGLYVF